MKSDIKAVASEAGVSVSTVSRALTKPELVSPKTRKKVIEVAKELNFSISRSAVSLKSGQSLRIALLMNDDIATWFNSHTYSGLNSVFHPAGYDISVYTLIDAEKRHDFFTDLPVRRNVDAVIVNSFNIDATEVSNLKSMNVPVVGINVPSSTGFDAAIAIDDLKAMHTAVDHLVALGHRSIGFVGETGDTSNLHYSADIRLQGFEEACSKYPEVTPQLLLFGKNKNYIDEAVNGILTADPQLTAICFLKDEVALPILYRLLQYGREIPRDFSFIGFDDIELAAASGLTTLHQNPYELGVKAANMTLKAMGKEHPQKSKLKDSDHENNFITVPVPLMLRRTTAPLQNN